MKQLTIDDVMTPTVVVVREDAPFKELVRIMHEYRVSGVPVVDADKRLVGIVTEADLLAAEEEARPEGKVRRTFLEWFIHPASLARIEAATADLRAADVMTPAVVTVTPATPVTEAARALLDAGVKRLPVVDADRHVVGIVSRRDLLLPFLRTDDEIREEIAGQVVTDTMWIDPSTLEIEVEEGVVTLRGEVERESVKRILLGLVRRVVGVVGVEDKLTYAREDGDIRVQGARSAPRWDENWARRPDDGRSD